LEVLYWILAPVPALLTFVTAHWETHREVGRRLEGDALDEWRALTSRQRLALRWTVRRGRAVADAARAGLATSVAVAEREFVDQPKLLTRVFAFAAAAAGLGVAVALLGALPPAAMLFAFAALFLWSALSHPALVRCLSRGAEQNARLAAERV
jgi:hypothetical protein